MAITAALELVVRVSLLLAVAAVVASALRHRSAATRHLVWAIALAASLALPVFSYVAPAWEVAVLPASETPVTSPPAGVAGPDARINIHPASEFAAGGAVSGGPSVSNHRPSQAAAPAQEPSRGWTWREVAFASWMAGVLTVLFRLALGSARMWWLARRARLAADRSWLPLARRLASAFGVGGRVEFLEGGPAAMPMTWGLLKARVLLPDSASNWPVARQRVVLLHELAHVKRRDCLTQLLAQLACAIYWFNPLAWLAARRLRAEREHACDDLVLAAGTRGSDYADHLLEIARSLRGVGLPTWAAVAMAHRSQLEGRLMAILDPDVPRRSPSRAGAAGLAAAAAIVALPIVLVTPVPQAAPVATAEAVQTAPGDAVARDAAESPQWFDEPEAQPRPRVRVDSKPVADGVREGIRAAIPAVAAVIPNSMLEGVVDGVRDGVADAIAEWEQGPPQGGVPGGVPGGVRGGVDGPEGRKHPADPRAVAALLEALKDTDTEVREQAMQALASLRVPEAIGPMRAALKDASPDVREQAAYALGQMRDTGSVDALVSALRDENASVREQAAYALGQIRDRRAGAPLAGALKDVNASVREQAAYALGQLRDTSAVAALGAALKDENADVREQAAYALGQIRDEAAVDPLIGALEDEDADVREQAAYALGQIRSPRAIDGLTGALKDSNPEVRRQAAYALGQISR